MNDTHIGDGGGGAVSLPFLNRVKRQSLSRAAAVVTGILVTPVEIWVDMWRWFGELDVRHDMAGIACTWTLRAVWLAVCWMLFPALWLSLLF